MQSMDKQAGGGTELMACQKAAHSSSVPTCAQPLACPLLRRLALAARGHCSCMMHSHCWPCLASCTTPRFLSLQLSYWVQLEGQLPFLPLMAKDCACKMVPKVKTHACSPPHPSSSKMFENRVVQKLPANFQDFLYNDRYFCHMGSDSH